MGSIATSTLGCHVRCFQKKSMSKANGLTPCSFTRALYKDLSCHYRATDLKCTIPLLPGTLCCEKAQPLGGSHPPALANPIGPSRQVHTQAQQTREGFLPSSRLMVALALVPCPRKSKVNREGTWPSASCLRAPQECARPSQPRPHGTPACACGSCSSGSR